MHWPQRWETIGQHCGQLVFVSDIVFRCNNIFHTDSSVHEKQKGNPESLDESEGGEGIAIMAAVAVVLVVVVVALLYFVALVC